MQKNRAVCFVLVACALFSGCGLGSSEVAVSSDQLFSDYRANEVAADAKYKGKVLDVSGTVTEIGNDMLGDAFVALYGDGMFSVQCFFNDKAQLAAINKGQKVQLKGVCDGLMGNVLIKKCEFE